MKIPKDALIVKGWWKINDIYILKYNIVIDLITISTSNSYDGKCNLDKYISERDNNFEQIVLLKG